MTTITQTPIAKPDRWQLIVFDWDGTVVDSAARIVAAVHAAAQSLDLVPAPAQDIVCQIGLSLDTIFQTLYPNQSGDNIARLRAAYRLHWAKASSIDTPLFDGAVPCFDRIVASGALLAIATGKSRRGLDRSLDETGLRRYFAASRAADEAFAKPNPQLLFDVLELTGQDRRQTLMVGDTVYDMQMAANAGVEAVGVCWGSHERQQLLEAGALTCFDDFHTLCEWITAAPDLN